MMGESGKYYDVEDFKSWKRRQGQAYKIPPRPNFLAAAHYLWNFFDGKKLNWAVMGSFAMLCLGSRREMPDIHIIYEAQDYSRIKSKLEKDQRVRLPKDMNSLFPAKILISTGPKYKDVDCMENVDVEVDLVPPGSNGSPPNDIFRRNQVQLRLNERGRVDNFKGLNMLYLLKTTIHYCKSPDLVWDPKKDIVFLCHHYAKEIEPIRNQLNARDIQENFLGTRYFASLPFDAQRQCYHVLLGKEPPPMMAVTPPAPYAGHRPSASASDATSRPRIPSHKSTPSLNSATQQPSALLSPPLPVKSKLKKTLPAPNSAPPTQSTASPSSQGQAFLGAATATADPRARYHRQTGSAPNTPSASRDVSPESNAANASQPKSMDSRAPNQQQPQGVPSYKAQPNNGAQNMGNVFRPQMVSGNAQGSMGMTAQPMSARPQKSMPHLKGSVPVYAHAHAHAQSSIPPIPKGPPNPPAGAAFPVIGAAVTTEQWTQPRQHQGQYQGPFQGQPQGQARQTQNHIGPSPPMANVKPYIVPKLPPHGRNEQQPRQPSNSHNGDNVRPAQNAQYTEARRPPGRSLSLVGPEGLYPAPLKASQQAQRAQPSAPSQSGFVFELDAGPPVTSPPVQSGPPSGFIAELPAEVDMPPPAPAPARNAPKQYDVSPVSPEQNAHAVPASVQPPQPQMQSPPLNSQPQFSPYQGGLPASLMAGGARRSPQNSISQPPPPPQPAHPQTHAVNSTAHTSNFQRYYSPPASAPNSGQPSPNPSPRQAPESAYKAYAGPISPPLPPAAASAKLQNAPFMPNMQASVPTMQQQAPYQGPPQNTYGLPPDLLRAGPQGPPPQQTLPFHRINPLGANPPTPPVPSAPQQTAQQNAYAAYSSPAYPASNESQYLAFGTPQAPPQAPPQQTIQQSNVYEQSYFTPAPNTAPAPQPAQQHTPAEPTPYEPSHQRNISHDSQASNASHDSQKLAQEYQLDLPDYGAGYGSDYSSDEGQGKVGWNTQAAHRRGTSEYDFT